MDANPARANCHFVPSHNILKKLRKFSKSTYCFCNHFNPHPPQNFHSFINLLKKKNENRKKRIIIASNPFHTTVHAPPTKARSLLYRYLHTHTHGRHASPSRKKKSPPTRWPFVIVIASVLARACSLACGRLIGANIIARACSRIGIYIYIYIYICAPG